MKRQTIINCKSILNTMGGMTVEEIFANSDYLKVLYFLARENPHINAERVAKKFKFEKPKADLILNRLSYHHLAFMEDEEKGYTLTPSGLACLYNFHKNYNRME